MKPFMDADFLLTNPISRQLYREAAESMPIYDYHSHLSAQSIAQNERYENLTHLLLSQDHYKWRLLLTAGEAEDRIRGNASDWEKFLSFARVLQGAVGNPLYHWIHLELQRLFDIHEPLNEQTARRIWDMCNEKLRGNDYRAQAIINRYKVHTLFTCEDILSDLVPCLTLQNAPEFKPRLRPIFCPDQAVLIHQSGFSSYVSRLASKTGIAIKSTADLLRALEQRMDYFHAMGCRAADHMLEPVPRCRP
ncbi:MAG: glucuronate isomerase, partial [Thermotogaceae bacterium]|nr:glucuronate isomerase [Thermotogaceae bacterium]